MAKFRKKPVVIDAIQITGTNLREIEAFFGETPRNIGWSMNDRTGVVNISTMEGQMRGDVGDWIIRGVKGEFYPCKPDVFAATYEPTEPQEPR